MSLNFSLFSPISVEGKKVFLSFTKEFQLEMKKCFFV